MPRRWIVVLVIVAAAIGGAAGSAITILVNGGDDDPVRGTVVHLGAPEWLARFTPQPFCVTLHHFCITQPETGHPLALYTYDPHAAFREQGCEVRWEADAEQTAQDGTVIHGLFADPCGGSRLRHQRTPPVPAFTSRPRLIPGGCLRRRYRRRHAHSHLRQTAWR